MSLILDALKRAEHERKKSQPVPDLQTVHDPLPLSSPPPDSKKRPHLWLIMAVLVLLGLGAYFLYQAQTQSEPVSREPSQRPPALTSGDVTPSPEREGKPTADQRPPAHETPGVTGQPAGNPQEASAPADLAALYASAREAEKPAQDDPVQQLYAPPPAASEAEPASQPVPAAPEVRAESTPAATTPVAAPIAEPLPDPAPLPDVTDKTYESLINIPDIGDLPWSFRKEIPTINYSSHNFAPGGAKSVVINGRPHQPGSALAPDLVLEEIYMDGAIFRYKQLRFKLRALNSWVNM